MLLCFKERGVIMLADLPDFNRIEKLHRATAPSEAAYNLIHCHCVVIATI